jgi:hypothetical protein
LTASSRLGMDCNRRYGGEVTVGCMLLWDLEYSPYLKVTVWQAVSCWHHVGARIAGRVTRGPDQAPSVAHGVAQGPLSEAHPRLTSSSGLERRCSPSRTKPDLAEQENHCD